jgi:hypothetical protein
MNVSPINGVPAIKRLWRILAISAALIFVFAKNLAIDSFMKVFQLGTNRVALPATQAEAQ